jgi:lysozyme family protein
MFRRAFRVLTAWVRQHWSFSDFAAGEANRVIAIRGRTKKFVRHRKHQATPPHGTDATLKRSGPRRHDTYTGDIGCQGVPDEA